MKMLPRSGTQIGWFADSALTNKSLLLHLNPQVLRAIWPPCTVSHKVQPLLYLSNPRLVNAGNYIKTWEHIMITLSGYLPFDHQYIHLLKGTHDVVSTRPSKDGDTRTFIFSHKSEESPSSAPPPLTGRVGPWYCHSPADLVWSRRIR